MDNFKAFKSWVTNFMQQIMMAFGTIVGINLLLLILPYVQNFKFFDYEILNYMMNVIMLVVGLVMAKDFMSMISGFVGGADANQLGEGMKGEVGNKIKQGVTGGARVVGGALRIGASAATAPIRAGKKVVRGAKKVANITASARANHAIKKGERKLKKAEKVDSLVAEMDDAIANDAKLKNPDELKKQYGKRNVKKYNKAKSDEAMKDRKNDLYMEQLGRAETSMRSFMNDDTLKKIDEADNAQVYQWSKRGSGERNKAKAKRRGQRAYEDAISQGMTQEHAEREKYAAMAKVMYKGEFKDMKENYKFAKSNAKDRDSYDRNKQKELLTTNAEIKADKISSKYGLEKNKDTGEYQFKNGNKPKLFEDNGFFKSLGKKINEGIDGMTLGRTIADSFVKTIDGVGSGLGLDKVIKAATDEMGKSLTFKGGPFKPSVAGDALQKKQHAEIMKQDKEQTTALNDIRKAIEELRKDTNKNAQEAKNNPKP